MDMRHSGGKAPTGQSRVAPNYNEKGEIEFEEAIIDTMGKLESLLCFFIKVLPSFDIFPMVLYICQ